MGDLQRREFREALLDADSFEDLPGKWQAAVVDANGGACLLGRPLNHATVVGTGRVRLAIVMPASEAGCQAILWSMGI
jgi:hypothetical protein